MATMDSESLSNNSFTLSSVSKHYLIDSSKDVSILYYFFLRLFYLSDSSYLSICKAFGLQAFIHSLYYIHLYSYSANYGDEAYFDRQNMEYQQLLIEYYELLLIILSSIIKTYHIKSSTLVWLLLFFLFYRSICWFWIMSLCILFFITLTSIIVLLFCSWIWSNCILVMRLITSRITLVVLCFLNTFPLTFRCYRRVWGCTSLPSRRISSTWCIWRRIRRSPQPPSSVQFYYHPLVVILSPVLSILCIWITCTRSFMPILNLHSYYYNNMFPCWWQMYDSFCHVLLSSVVYYSIVWRMRAVYPSRLHVINCFRTQSSLYIITTSFSICWSICRWSLPTNTFPYAICYWTLTRTCLRSSSSLSLSMYVFDALFISSCHSLRWSPASFICWTSTPISWVTVPFFWLGIPMIIFPSNTTIPFFSSFFFCITTSPSPWTSLFPSCDSWRCLLPILSYRLSFALSSKLWMLPMINSSSRCILPCWMGSNQKCRWFLRSHAISTCCSSFNPISLFFLPCPRSGPRWRNRRLSLWPKSVMFRWKWSTITLRRSLWFF